MSCNPCNISNHCVSLFCSNDEYDIFKQQAHLDYLRFLEYRSNELIPGGVLILCFPCSNDKGLFGFEILFQILYKCATLLQNKNYSIILIHYTFTRLQQGELTLDEFVKDHTRFLRSWAEPSLRETLERNNHRSNEGVETLLDQFWNLYEREVKELLNQFDLCCFYAYLILKKDLI
ncbi:unnamed protein product [Rotaria sp. Silwood2]|nr:unnamed protein product [Rotaria sp. Silwood2]CAF3392811.1 unnamed protein product [Rotaria sp. Silwood2]